ncbi:hypothetical protein JRQ81_009041 [Phrynocephalus forsythii]|uniref:Coiled-coil domain-containing protein 187 n=1 Tax=Phrynocephalus forsythii TaxID=171643 RepID=A0A9Q0XBA9_9SAUR|nr:hypothetical protein JRQ81_009041 [Phrynocephalus forsythii]
MQSGRRATGSEEDGSGKRCPDGVAGIHSPGAHFVDSGGPSAVWMRPKGRSSQGGHAAGKENQPTPHNQARGGRRSLQSPEQIHTFMNKKSAERKKRSREEKLASQQAQEAKDTRLREVYRKQKEALRRRKSPTEVQQGNRAVRSTVPTKDMCGLEMAREKHPKSERMGWLRQSPQSLLRREAHLHSAEDLETTRSTEGPTTIIDSPGVVRCRSTPESFLPPKELILGFGEWSPWQKPTLSPSQTKEDRIRALCRLAQDLSERLDREMGTVEVANRSAHLERKGELPGVPTVSKPSPANLKPVMPLVGLGAALDGDAVWESSCPQNPPRDAGKTQEEMVHRGGFAAHIDTGRPRLLTSSPGCAVSDGLRRDKNLSRGDARPGVLTATSQFVPGRRSISSQAKHYIVSHHNPGLPEDDVKNCFGKLQPKMMPNVLWSEIGQFYGSSSTFGRFGLSMVEQSLREEELHARHQTALLRLREKALQEKTKAELAWLEHEASIRKSSGNAEATSAFLEKQSALLMELKQEQVEIWHLQNLCKAAHRERKLLLKQQRELLMLQQTTAQLWRQLSEQSGKPPHNEDTNDAPLSGRSREGSGHVLQQGKEKDRRDISPRGMQMEQERLKQKPRLEGQQPETLDVGANDLYSFRNQPAVVGSAGSKLEGEHKGDETDLRNCSKDALPGPSDKELGRLASAVPCAERRSFSPSREKPCLDSEFHQVCALLISISGSSRSASDAEAEGAQDTDLSLPDEFVFQEEGPYHSGDRPGDPPAMPETTASTCPTALCGRYSKQGHISVPCLQQKTLEELPGGERLEEGWLAQANTSASGMNPSSSHVCNPEPCAGSQGPEKAVSQSAVESAAASASGDTSCQGSGEKPRWKSSGAALGTADGLWGGENPFHLEDGPLTHAPEAFWESVAPIQDTWPSGKRQPTPSLSPDPLATRSGSEGRAGYKDTADASRTRTGGNVPLRCPGVSRENDNARVSLQCPESTGRITQGNERSFSENTRSTEESGTPMQHPRLSEAGPIFPARTCPLASRDAMFLPGKTLRDEVEDEIVSPVDEVLSYGSADLSSTAKEDTFPNQDLPLPPQDLSGSDQDSPSSFPDFPTPPGDGELPETRELQYALEEDLSVE